MMKVSLAVISACLSCLRQTRCGKPVGRDKNADDFTLSEEAVPIYRPKGIEYGCPRTVPKTILQYLIKEMVNPSEKDINKKFFYVNESLDEYDDTIELVVPQYQLMGEALIDLLKFHFGVYDEAGIDDVSGHILDIGAGTGTESMRVMREFPNVKMVCLDLYASMQKRFFDNFESEYGRDSDRCTEYVVGDLLKSAGEPANLLRPLSGKEKYKAVITTFTIHHFSSAEKEEAYRRIYEVLEDGGILVNGDLFSYQSPELRQQAKEYDLRWIASQFKIPNPQFTRGAKRDDKTRNRLSKKWLDHYKNDNTLDPVESKVVGTVHESSEKCENLDAKGQTEMLLNAGFSQAGCPFRYWQVGILWAQK
jgi:ubiquinone/menaquinone biosynthesis C-methylase UbiE